MSTLVDCLKYYGICSPAAVGLFIVCIRVGKWFDADVDPDFKLKFTAALRSGGWLIYFQLADKFVSTFLDRWLGRKLLTWTMLYWSLIINVGTSLIIGLFWFVNFSFDDNSSFFHNLSSLRIVHLRFFGYVVLGRVLPSALIDFVTLLRVRVFSRLSLSGTRFKYLILLAFITDAVTVTFSIFVLFVVYTAMFDLVYLGNLSFLTSSACVDTARQVMAGQLPFSEFTIQFCFDNLPVAILSAVGGMVPAMVYYFYLIAVLIMKLSVVIASAFAVVSQKLRFTAPFTFIGYVIGTLCAFLVTFFAWLAALV